MPSGYTEPVQNGRITTLRDFAAICARGMMFLISMRDEPHNAPIPKEFAPNTEYHDERIAAARAVLAEVSGLSLAACETRAASDHHDERARIATYRAKDTQGRQRYEAMIAQVNAWEAPLEFANFKAFMLDQLTKSVNFDCSNWEDPKPLTGEEWKEAAIKKAVRDIGHHEQARAEEIARVAERNRYLALFHKEFPAP